MQQRRLIRTRDLAGFRAALVDLARRSDPLSARRRVVIVPTHAAAELLRQTLESDLIRRGQRTLILPDLVTRDEWTARLHAALPEAASMLTRIEREVLLASAAARTAERARMPGWPFRSRPGLVAGMLDFYDELQRRQRTVRRFAGSLFDQLRVERGTDRGSEGLIHQTSFLGLAFLAYQRGLAASGGMDEHVLRRVLLQQQPALPVDHVIVAVADHPSDPRGLWPADFDLLGRLGGLDRLDIVVTDETHDAGFRERVEGELPGIETAHWDASGETRKTDAGRQPIVVRPTGDGEAICATSRDREEELRDVARRIRRRAGETGGEIRESVAVVFARRLPYLYLARQVFLEAGVPFQTFDALPLAAEPWAALLDVVLAVARTGGTREAAVALLQSRMLRFEVEGVPVGLRDAAALDAVLAERRAIGEADSYPADVEAWFGERATRERVERARAMRGARAAAAARESLLPFRSGTRASEQVGALAVFLRRANPAVPADDPWRERQLRARAAVLGVLDEIAGAFRRYDDRPRDPDDLTASIHHAIESRTFSPRRGQTGVHLVDAVAARFGEFDHVHLVGLVETDWSERARSSVFYTTGLLKSLGWPQDVDQRLAHMAEFRDLVGLPARTLSLHAFQLEGDAVVALSPMVEVARDRPSRVEAPAPPRRTFADEVLTAEVVPPGIVDGDAAAWLARRQERPALDDPRYRGVIAPSATPGSPASGYRVSRVDRYVTCPFKYFSENVLGLPEEREEMSGLTPLERGTLVHTLFEHFYRTWQEEGRGTITPETLPLALDLFGRLTRTALAKLPTADRVLEETRLVGSIVARGLAERVFELEADTGGTVVDRLIEFTLAGAFTFPLLAGLKQATIEVRGKADRIDIFADGSLRVIDYKLGRLPDQSSIQIGVYAHCARQWLEHRDGRPHPVADAMYLAFGDDREIAGPIGGKREPVAMVVEARASAFARYVEEIEAGQFPARPRKVSECSYCRYAGVCRKEYSPAVATADDSAPADPEAGS